MKTRTLVLIFILVLAVMVVAGSYATDKGFYVQYPEEEIYGTWINEDYDVTQNFSKYEWNPDGTWTVYGATTYKNPFGKGSYTITDKWTDDMGNVWYKINWENVLLGRSSQFGRSGYWLIRIDDSGTILEEAMSFTEYPTELDQTHYGICFYGIYYRQ